MSVARSCTAKATQDSKISLALDCATAGSSSPSVLSILVREFSIKCSITPPPQPISGRSNVNFSAISLPRRCEMKGRICASFSASYKMIARFTPVSMAHTCFSTAAGSFSKAPALPSVSTRENAGNSLSFSTFSALSACVANTFSAGSLFMIKTSLAHPRRHAACCRCLRPIPVRSG